MKVKFKKLHEDAVLPSYAKDGDAGLDMTAISFEFGDGIVTYGTGLSAEIPSGHVGLIFPRSSVYKTDLTLSNCVGVIDSGYRGEIKAVFRDTDKNGINKIYFKGDRIMQMIIMPYPKIVPEWSDELSKTKRGSGGYGSTGR